MGGQRLDKLIAKAQNLTRKEVRQGVRKGKALVGGVPVYDPAKQVSPQTQEVVFDGQVVRDQAFFYLVMNKPAGVLSATEDRSAKTVLDLIPPGLRRKGLFPVGRLDKDTTGLLLITNDGQFAHQLLSPKKEIYKTYIAELDGEVTENTVQIFRQGVVLADGTQCKSAVLNPLSPTSAEIQICEGKYHQIKRMFGVVNLGVTALKRTAIGGYVLPDFLKPGECMEAPEDLFDQIKPDFFRVSG